jgi:hypothetical protein
MKRTLHPLRGARINLAIGKLLYPEQFVRPRTRAECPDVRPCPFVGCRYHLGAEVNPTGSLTLRTDVEPTEMDPSCALDVADRGPHTLAQVADAMGITRERVRQLEDRAIGKVRRHLQILKEEVAA